ncbi:hypothetical protein HKD27_02510 [Gluconobacter sp. R75690]|uniref:hypothetical protein n=1 Tax=unclassified Gluconobacter TaxID=2644261 RepID=UPI00188B12A7|nr:MULTISPECIES: hypothetical protein [unclassified Gluconobacter]MBF0849796.1 hypothetical protein [Gluconobacter sp. R75690]MBF0878757.1 hypothetical protein [Gluconobacter sp. R75828]
MTKQPGLDGRHRDENGEIRRKNGNTLIETLRETYGPSFAPGYKGTDTLEYLLAKEGKSSLSEYLKGR